jgi:hypothetical protein
MNKSEGIITNGARGEIIRRGEVGSSSLIACKGSSLRANKDMWSIKRTVSSRDKDVIIKLYSALVRPHLEYCSQALTIKTKAETEMLEKIQSKATKMISSLRNLPSELHQHSLKYRCTRGDLIQVYQYIQGLSKCHTNALLPKATEHRTRGHPAKLWKDSCRTETRRQSFTQRVVTPWNALKACTVGAKNLEAFKCMLDKEINDQIFRWNL